MKRPEFLITVTIGETREQYRENNKALDNTMKLVMTGVWEELKSIAGESALNRGLTELIIQQEYIREREKENWGLREERPKENWGLREERPKEPEEDQAMEKIKKSHKEYIDYLTTLSRATGIKVVQLDNHFTNLYWTKKKIL